MTQEDRERIISEEFADLLIEYSGDEAILNRFPDAVIEIVNYLHAVVHVPVEDITNETILQLGYSVIPHLYGLISHESFEASGIGRIRSIPNFDLRGQGVLLGFVDSGIDYTNPIFRNADGSTRIAALWDQTIQTGNPPEGMYYYGTEYTREQINRALQSEDPLAVVPSTDADGHGTMIAGIAGGKENTENDFIGVASDAEFVVVKLKPAKSYLKDFWGVPQDALCYQTNDILFGLGYLLDAISRFQKPIVICVALGTSQGGHDGRGLLSGYLSLIASTPSLAIIVAAGNEGNGRRHYRGRVDSSIGYDTVELNVGPNDSSFFMELWGPTPSLFSIDIQTPSGENVSRISSGVDIRREVTFVFEPTVINIDFQIIESQSGDQLILFRFTDAAAGIWRFRVYEQGNLGLEYNIWLPMENFISDETFFIRSDPYITILSLGNATVPITATAYNHGDESLYLNSSRGFNRIGWIEPSFAAPGVNVVGPTLAQGFAEYTGTSVSAAHTTGVAAMLMEWAVVRGNFTGMSSVEMKRMFIRGARRDANTLYPNRDWGYGILDIYNVFDSLRAGVVL